MTETQAPCLNPDGGNDCTPTCQKTFNQVACNHLGETEFIGNYRKALIDHPLMVELRADVFTFLPFLDDIEVTGRAFAFREIVLNSAFPTLPSLPENPGRVIPTGPNITGGGQNPPNPPGTDQEPIDNGTGETEGPGDGDGLEEPGTACSPNSRAQSAADCLDGQIFRTQPLPNGSRFCNCIASG